MLSLRHVVLSLFVLCLCGGAATAQVFQVGAARRDITPPTGSSHYRGASTGVHDPLYARALVLREGDESAALVICDLSNITRDLSLAVRRRISEQTGIPYAHSSVTGTHTHTGPRYQRRAGDPAQQSGSEGPDSYGAYLIEQIVGAAVDAAKAVRA